MKDKEILIVEDDRDVSGLLKQLLHDIGFSLVDEARNGRIAKEVLALKNYDIILLDIELPDYSGIEVLRYIRQHHAESLVIMCSAHSTVDNVKQALSKGAKAFVVKPFTLKKIQAAMTKVLSEET